MARDPHSRNLRANRVIAPEIVYSVTTTVMHREPALGTITGRIVVASLEWLRSAGRIRLYGFVVMPDHVHAVLAPAASSLLPEVMKSLKGFSGKRIQAERGLHGALWQDGYFDHAIRTPSEAWAARKYIEDNPVRAGLVGTPEAYRLSSAWPELRGMVDPIE